MGLASDLRILYHLALRPVRGQDHAARMESFYSGQAQGYDDFRKRLLKGRQELWNLIQLSATTGRGFAEPTGRGFAAGPVGGTWVDMGGGTGANLEYFRGQESQVKGRESGDGRQRGRLAGLDKIYVVDLSTSLLEIARQRAKTAGWSNVEAVAADATTFRPPEGQVDVVTFSYSLTMIPDWFAAIENAWAMLKPGGTIGVVDFYIARKYAGHGHARHRWLTRTFWPTWFALDNVFPSADHVPYLHRQFDTVHFEEHRAKVPYVPVARVPYYLFVGRKKAAN